MGYGDSVANGECIYAGNLEFLNNWEEVNNEMI